MLGEKGISPLIAAVILIAFVIAVAGIASTFFTGFTKEQKAGVESKAGTIVDCSVATLDLDQDTVDINNTDISNVKFNFVLSNTGQEDLAGLKVILYNSTYAGTCLPSDTDITVGETITLSNSTSCAGPSGTITKVQVTTTTCAGVRSELTNETGTWRVTA
jgi:flagellin-like protein